MVRLADEESDEKVLAVKQHEKKNPQAGFFFYAPRGCARARRCSISQVNAPGAAHSLIVSCPAGHKSYASEPLCKPDG